MTNKNKNKSFPLAALLALSSAYFITGTTGMSVIGLTLPISADLGFPEADIAFLVLAFALTFCLTAPLAQVFLARLPRVRILILGLVMMSSGLGIASFMDNFEALFYARILMGAGGGLITPMCSAIGAGLAAPALQGRAMSVVFSGLTIASVAGVPLSAYLGILYGWRPVLGGISVLAITIAVIVSILVKDRSSSDSISFGNLIGAFIDKRSALPLMTTFLQMTSLFCTYALVAPYAIEKFAVSNELVALILFIYGISGVIGNTISGVIVDRLGTTKIIMISFSGMLGSYFLLWMVPPYQELCFLGFSIMALFGMGFHSPQQQRIANINPAKRSLYLALNAASLYLGISTGSWIANVITGEFGYLALPLTSIIVLSFCILLFLYSLNHNKKTSPAHT
jgi:MFS transporter, DHA1 family, inner membrane transport protein